MIMSRGFHGGGGFGRGGFGRGGFGFGVDLADLFSEDLLVVY